MFSGTLSIKKILTDEVYLGHMVQGRKQSGLCEGQKQRVLPKSEWTIVRNTHKPLIDEETFQIVQRMAEDASALYHERVGKYQHLGDSPNLFTRLIFCADCGHPLVRHKQVIHGRRVQYVFICQRHIADPASCPLKYVLEDDLKEILWETIQHEIALSDDMEKLVEQYSRTPEVTDREQALRRDAAEAKQTYDKAGMFYESLYPNYVEHIILTITLCYRDEYLALIQRLNAGKAAL